MKTFAISAAAAAPVATTALADDAQLMLDRVSTGGLSPIIVEDVVIPPAEPASSIGTLGLIGLGIAIPAAIYLLLDDDDDDDTTVTSTTDDGS